MEKQETEAGKPDAKAAVAKKAELSAKDIQRTSRFKKDYRRVKSRGLDMSLLKAVIITLQNGEELDESYRTTRTEYFTRCNDCGFLTQGSIYPHQNETGHTRYSTDVPITSQVIIRAAFDEQVLLSDVFDEKVPHSQGNGWLQGSVPIVWLPSAP
jgi:hypothetical protein